MKSGWLYFFTFCILVLTRMQNVPTLAKGNHLEMTVDDIGDSKTIFCRKISLPVKNCANVYTNCYSVKKLIFYVVQYIMK